MGIGEDIDAFSKFSDVSTPTNRRSNTQNRSHPQSPSSKRSSRSGKVGQKSTSQKSGNPSQSSLRRSNARSNDTSNRSLSSNKTRGSTCEIPSSKPLSLLSMSQNELDKKKSSFVILHAQNKQKWLDCFYVFLTSIQAACIIMVAVAGLYVQTNTHGFSTMSFYITQTILEIFLFVIALCSTWSDKQCYRVSLIAVFAAAIFYNVIWIIVHKVSDGSHPAYFCAGREYREQNPERKCILGLFSAEYNVLFVSILLCAVHSILFVIATFVAICYEGSMSHYRSTERGRKLIEMHNQASRRKHHRSSKNKRKNNHKKNQSSLRSNRSTAEIQLSVPAHTPPDSLVTQRTTSEKHGICMTDKEGKTEYGAIATDTVETITENSSGTAISKTTTGRLVRPGKKGNAVVEELPKQVENYKTPPGTSSVAKECFSALNGNETSERKHVNHFNSVTRMPALESPIAYLKKKSNRGEAHNVV